MPVRQHAGRGPEHNRPLASAPHLLAAPTNKNCRKQQTANRIYMVMYVVAAPWLASRDESQLPKVGNNYLRDNNKTHHCSADATQHPATQGQRQPLPLFPPPSLPASKGRGRHRGHKGKAGWLQLTFINSWATPGFSSWFWGWACPAPAAPAAGPTGTVAGTTASAIVASSPLASALPLAYRRGGVCGKRCRKQGARPVECRAG